MHLGWYTRTLDAAPWTSQTTLCSCDLEANSILHVQANVLAFQAHSELAGRLGDPCKTAGSPTEGGNWRARENKHKEHGSAPLLLSGGKVHSPRFFYGHVFLRYNALAFASIRKMTKVLVGGWADVVDPSFSETASLQVFMGEKKQEKCVCGVGMKEAGSISLRFIHPSGGVFFCMSSLWSRHSYQRQSGPEGHWSKPYWIFPWRWTE